MKLTRPGLMLILVLLGLSNGAWPSAAGVNPVDISHLAKLTAPDGAPDYQFGASVSLSGDTLVVGAPRTNLWEIAQGAAYLFFRNPAGQWVYGKELNASDGAAAEALGCSVSLDGDTLVVGARMANIGGNQDQGAVYVFSRDLGGADNWGQVQKLSASDGRQGDHFGSSVSMSGNTLVVGAMWAAVDSKARQGAAYVFYRAADGSALWTQRRKITATDSRAGDEFGASVSLSGDTVVVGADQAAVAGDVYRGAAYVFARHQGGEDQWDEVAKITASDGQVKDWFGASVSLNGDTLVVGAPQATVGTGFRQGAAYVFSRNQGGDDQWGAVSKLTASDLADHDGFGRSVSMGEEVLVVGADGADVGGKEDTGAAYVFSRKQGEVDPWSEVKKQTVIDGAEGDGFGFSASLSGHALILGARFADGGKTDQGAVHVYGWPYDAYLPVVTR